jgi:hypothetical protein
MINKGSSALMSALETLLKNSTGLKIRSFITFAFILLLSAYFTAFCAWVYWGENTRSEEDDRSWDASMRTQIKYHC